MLVVDASCLYEVVADTERAEEVRTRLARDPEHVAPAIIDAEIIGVVRNHHRLGKLDATSAAQAVEDLQDWPGRRFELSPMLDRVWELRNSMRSCDAFYVALAEELGGVLVTLDGRLARAQGLRCSIEVL